LETILTRFILFKKGKQVGNNLNKILKQKEG